MINYESNPVLREDEQLIQSSLKEVFQFEEWENTCMVYLRPRPDVSR